MSGVTQYDGNSASIDVGMHGGAEERRDPALQVLYYSGVASWIGVNRVGLRPWKFDL
jgi:hypothetical protein